MLTKTYYESYNKKLLIIIYPKLSIIVFIIWSYHLNIL